MLFFFTCFTVASLVWPDYLDGNLRIDEFITHHRKLEDLFEGFNDMHASHVCCLSGILSDSGAV